MGHRLKIVLNLVAFSPLFTANPLNPTNESNPCGDWTNYTNEKCLKLLETAGLKTYEDSENACKSLRGNSFSRLVTIKSSEQQDFLYQLLYENNVSESVWLGLKENNNSQQLEWNDGLELVYSNLMNANVSGHLGQCVEMNPVGLWVAVSCSKKNIAVCEAAPTRPMADLQSEQAYISPTKQKLMINQSEKDCEEKILMSEKKTDLLKEAADKTMDLLKEVKERIDDIEKSEGPKQAIVFRKRKASDKGGLTIPNVCGDWISYKDEKCVKIVHQVGAQSQEEAEVTCRALGNDSNVHSLPKVITIKSKEEQEFLQQFLFGVNEMVDNVWLGLTKNRNSGMFEWTDGSKLSFTHWGNQTVSGDTHRCVQMVSGDGFLAAGLWVRVSCERNNAVLCERRPVWTLETLQNSFMNFKLEQAMKQKEWEEKLVKSETTLNALKRNPGSSSVTFTESNVCGHWTSYNDEKCVKIAERAGHQTQEDAELVCQAFATDLPSAPKLLTIKSKEEQEFVQRFLFVENRIVDNVWLGLSKKGSLFEWNDGSELAFNNWANETLSGEQHECVQMESGDGAVAAGLWLKVSCKRKNAVICERKSSWTLETLQNSFLNLKLQQEMRQKEWEQKFEQSELRNEASRQEIKLLKNNPVPIGFTYVELPNQPSPTTLWPTTKWTDVSSNYSGLFFRVAGGQAAPFGQIQDGNSPRLAQGETININVKHNINIPSDGSWSEAAYTGTFNSGGEGRGLRLRLSASEVRPRNQAIRIWKLSQ